MRLKQFFTSLFFALPLVIYDLIQMRAFNIVIETFKMLPAMIILINYIGMFTKNQNS